MTRTKSPCDIGKPSAAFRGAAEMPRPAAKILYQVLFDFCSVTYTGGGVELLVLKREAELG
jgi:hypothetical protein